MQADQNSLSISSNELLIKKRRLAVGLKAAQRALVQVESQVDLLHKQLYKNELEMQSLTCLIDERNELLQSLSPSKYRQKK